MGVPAFYRWLSEKYPKVVEDVLEDRVHLAHESGSTRVPFDSSRPNPTGLECDNLYIDMNGIIHPCSHPENGPQPKTEEEMYENVCRYVDRLFRAVRPRKLLYLAIDGVAPRAKMNQQRSRRFRSAQEAREQAAARVEEKEKMIEAGYYFDDEETTEAWDSNVITPGTPFMLRLSEFVRFYVRKRISTDKSWKKIVVIFSDASIPGEGEHKIMAHVRHQRTQPNFNPNLVHVLHGLDADLIMLALATHEQHFYILREEVLFGNRGADEAERRKILSGHADRQKALDEAAGAEAMQLPENKTKPLQRLSIPILRDYMAFEFKDLEHVPFKEISFERLIDDIVFLCFFVGNDFLPHLPSMDIRDGALDFLFNVYKRILPTLGDYITSNGGVLNLSHVDVILGEVGAIEDYIFNMKHQNEQNNKRRKQEAQERRKNNLIRNGKAPKADMVLGNAITSIPTVKAGRATKLLESLQNDNIAMPLGRRQTKERKVTKAQSKSLQENAIAAKKLKVELAGGDIKSKNIVASSEDKVVQKNSSADEGSKNHTGKRKAKHTIFNENGEEVNHNDSKKTDPEIAMRLLKGKVKDNEQKKLDSFAASVEDKVRLHESGWKDRYYTDKCKADDVAENGGKEHLFRSYVMGLCWVMKYYYDGCPSWKWYFPFHYSPFASDLRNIERFDKDCKSFELEAPFKPVEQLMAVLPEDSSRSLPKAARWLMSDPESPIIDFYPKDIACDPNGKAMPWLWVVLLPFIDEERLLDAIPAASQWTPEELLCNARGLDDGDVYCHVTHPLASAVTAALESEDPEDKLSIEEVADVKESAITGFVRRPRSSEVYPLDEVSTIEVPDCQSTLSSHDELFIAPIEPNAALCVAFTEPNKILHNSALLSGSKAPKSILIDSDKRIRRPNLNRGGSTISNLGGNSRDTGRNNSHQPGYGSMNISTYERGLAQRTGRGHQMHQAGTRAWGAMEPTPKIPKNHGRPHHQHIPTLFQQQIHSGGNFAAFNHGRGPGGNRGGRQHNFRDHRNHQNQRPNHWQPPAQHMPQQYRPVQYAAKYNQYNVVPHAQSKQSQSTQPRVPTVRQTHKKQPIVASSHLTHGAQHKQQPRVHPSLMKSLKSQLVSTLKKNQQRGEGTNN